MDRFFILDRGCLELKKYFVNLNKINLVRNNFFMQTKIINIKNKKAFEILKSLENINFIEIHEASSKERLAALKTSNRNTDADFFDMAGIWKNRGITTESIREQAWKRK